MGGGLDRAVFEWINRWPEGFAPTMEFFSEATRSGWVRGLLGAMLLAALLAGAKGRRVAVQALIAFPAANEMTDVLKALFWHERPCNAFAVIERVGCSNSSGTASAHSANMAAIAFVLFYHWRWRGSAWIAVALFTGLSRVYNGVHYPSQVLLGWSCGAVAGLVVTKAWETIVRRRSRVGEEGEPDVAEPRQEP